MSKTQDALRIAARAFFRLSGGAAFKQNDLKLLGDLCCLALPMKYRFTRAELDEIKSSKAQPLIDMNTQLNTMFILGVEYGVRGAEKGQNLQYCLDEARKQLESTDRSR
jgi:hypothetical protein